MGTYNASYKRSHLFTKLVNHVSSSLQENYPRACLGFELIKCEPGFEHGPSGLGLDPVQLYSVPRSCHLKLKKQDFYGSFEGQDVKIKV